MADKLDFLAGLQADGDTITLDGEPVCYVLGHTGRQVSTVEAAEWIVSACHRASRTCETCGRSYYALGRLCCDAVNPDGEWVEPDHFCGYYEPRRPPMPDITREELLAGLRLSRDDADNVSLYGPDGDHVIYVRGNLGLDLSAYQIGSWVADACHEYAARRRDQTHSAECWRLPGHEECARGLLKRWWPVIEAVREYAEARFEYERCNDFDGNLHAIMGLAAESVFDAAMRAIMVPAALKEDDADG